VAKRAAVFDGLHVKAKPHPRQGFNGLMQVALGRANERTANGCCKCGPLGTPGRTDLSTNGTCQLENFGLEGPWHGCELGETLAAAAVVAFIADFDKAPVFKRPGTA
jgi:hypothetical protein